MGKAKKHISDYAHIVVGSFVLALAISFFLVPCKISTGGVSGIATVLYYHLNIPISITTLVINLALFACGYRTLAKTALLKTLVGIFVFSACIELTDFLAELCAPLVEELCGDIWICAIFGGVLVGLGVGLVVIKEASTGGSDFAALMLHKILPHISVAAFIMLIDCVIIIVSGFAFADYRIMFYSVASLYISNKVTDFIIVRGDNAKSVYILSARNDEIASEIMDKLERGVTAIKSRGCYANREGEMLMCIVRTKEVPKVIKITRNIDSAAFVVISEVKEVRGLGFKEE